MKLNYKITSMGLMPNLVPAFVAIEKAISSCSDLGSVDWQFSELEGGLWSSNDTFPSTFKIKKIIINNDSWSATILN